MEREKRREILVCKAQKVKKKESQGIVEQSTLTEGGPLTSMCREQDWSTVEELVGAGGSWWNDKGGAANYHCMPTNTQYSMHLEYKDCYMYLELSIIHEQQYPTVCFNTMSHVLFAMSNREVVCL